MKKMVQTVNGFEFVDMTSLEVKKEAESGNKEAIRELINTKGDFAALTPQQKDAVLQLLLGIPADL